MPAQSVVLTLTWGYTGPLVEAGSSHAKLARHQTVTCMSYCEGYSDFHDGAASHAGE